MEAACFRDRDSPNSGTEEEVIAGSLGWSFFLLTVGSWVQTAGVQVLRSKRLVFRGQRINANVFGTKFCETPSGYGRPRRKSWTSAPKMRFAAAPVMGRKFLTQRRPGVRVRNVRGKFGPKSLCLCCFFFLEFCGMKKGPGEPQNKVKLRPPLCCPLKHSVKLSAPSHRIRNR